MQNKKTDKAERAKLFLPFDSLKGFREYLKEMERVIVKPKELSPESCELLDRKLRQLTIQSMVRVVYYDKDKQEYVELKGMVSKIDLEYQRRLRIVDQWVQIDNIIELEGEGLELEPWGW